MRLSVLDLFCGAGGLSLGFRWAGFHSTMAVDNYSPALQTFNANLGDHARSVDLSDNGVKLPKSDVIIGGPPCQGFSSAGARRAGDHRNSLVSCYAEIIAQLKPRAFVFENVEGFLTAERGERVFDLLDPLLRAGYRIHLRKVNAANYGVPQHRKRVIAVGGLGFDPTFPEPTHTAFGAPGALLAAKYLPLAPSVMETLEDLPPANPCPPGVPQGHFFRPLEGIDLERALMLSPGMTMRDLPESMHHESYRRRANRRVMDGTPSDNRGGAPAGVRRLKPNEPSKAITSAARVEFLHPTENRPLTLRECARIQTFPDGFVFYGSPGEQAQLIGNAVPPVFGHRIAQALALDLSGKATDSRSCKGALLSFQPTLSDGCSPALRQVTNEVNRRFRRFVADPLPTLWSMSELGEEDSMTLSKTQSAALTRIRAAGNSQLDERLDDEVCSYLLAVAVRDLGYSKAFPELPSKFPPFFTDQPLTGLRIAKVDFLSLYERFLDSHEDAQAYFACLAKLHKSRLKYERILSAQPLPTLDQVGPRGLLQFGSLSPKALAGLLFWRKWLFDLDNRAGQETGYLFEPIIAHAIGGVPFGAQKSPIKRPNNAGGRQVDAICDDKKRAYEFKVRVTIASSGQGRWGEELSFPAEARASGYTPVLVVIDPTPNPKLTELSLAFKKARGKVYTGEEAWEHLEEEAGAVMSKFIDKYVKLPLDSLLKEAPEKLPNFFASIEKDNSIRLTVGKEDLLIERKPILSLAEDGDKLPECR
jgi:DNA (cytosine-5)-methyltransferase 1